MRRRRLEATANGENAVDDDADGELDTPDDPSRPTTTKQEQEDSLKNQSNRSDPRLLLPTLLLLFARVSGCLLFAYGVFVGQTELCHHEECDMTYSMRMFLQLDMTSAQQQASPNDDNDTSSYRLFKFIDQRDPRHKTFQHQTQPLQGNQWCLGDPEQTMPVLYVPGHGGSYQQSRSLGAHGLQLTEGRESGQTRRFVQAIKGNLWTGNATRLDSFVYDVYALDFGEEGAGLHGHLVQRQSAMVADAVQFLVDKCQFASIDIVAHSIGGYAVRLALLERAEMQAVVHNVITLATPHATPVLAVEPSLFAVHARISAQDVPPHVALISIGGGLRDEMIPPEACIAKNKNAPSSSAILNLAATDIAAPSQTKQHSSSLSPPRLGMDHRAIVWCYNLLLPVRQILFVLRRSSHKNPKKRLEDVTNALHLPRDYDYLVSIQKSSAIFVASFGWWRSILAEMGLLYRIETLVGLYSVSCAIYAIVGVSPTSSWAVLLIAPVLVGMSSRHLSASWGSLLLQSTVANAAFVVLHVLAQVLSRWTTRFRRFSVQLFGCTVVVAFAVILLSVDMFLSTNVAQTLEKLGQLLFLATVPSVLLLCLRWNTWSSQKFVYLAWIAVGLPLLAAGLFYVTFIRHLSLPTSGTFAMIVLPLAVLPLSSFKRAEKKHGLTLSKIVCALFLMGSATTSILPEGKTLQFLLLLPLFSCFETAFDWAGGN